MVYGGPAPKPNKIGRTPIAEWTEVPDKPYDGPSPDLPKLGAQRRWADQVVSWWETVRRMPHAAMWKDSDWEYALETAYLRQQFWAMYCDGEVHTTMATELRRRDDNLGTTVEARRKLRIRYVDPGLLAGEDDEGDVYEPVSGAAGTVTDLSSRRRRLTG